MMRVLKFGGSSLVNADAVQHVAGLVREQAELDEVVLVCSACGGVTNHLVKVVEFVRAGRTVQALIEVNAISARHRALLFTLDLGADEPRAWLELEELRCELRELVARAPASKADAAWSDAVVSYGERASVRLVAAALRQTGVNAKAVDASEFLVTNDSFQSALPLWDETRARAAEVLGPLITRGATPVVTGFIGATRDGKITTLGRNSSDYSAAIIGELLDASEVCIWTDVDGVYDRDPRGGGESLELLEELSYAEALCLAERGAKVLHPRAIEPLQEKGIALRIRNTFRPEHVGTRIGPEARSLVR
jgi:aspartokinase/homoserine dehydrogenase 1